jgi:iron complex outermembrane recepter protein
VFNASYFKRQAMYKGARSFSAQASSLTGIFPNGSWNTGRQRPQPGGGRRILRRRPL